MANPENLTNNGFRQNPQNRAKGRPEGDQLRRFMYKIALEKAAYKEGGITKLEAIIENTIADALAGDLDACKYVLDCRCGKMPNVTEQKITEDSSIKNELIAFLYQNIPAEKVTEFLTTLEKDKEDASIQI